MSYKFDMSEYDKPLKQSDSLVDTNVSISIAKENALKNIDIAEKFIKKVSTKATEEQKRYIEERIAFAKHEINEAAKGQILKEKDPYLLPTVKDLDKDRQEEKPIVEKTHKTRTIHFIHKEMPTIGSGETDLFNTEIPSDSLRRIQEAEKRVLADVESIVKGNEQTEEVTRTIYVENEADPALRAQILDLSTRNTTLQAEVDRLQTEVDRLNGVIRDPGGLNDQITSHLATIAANDTEILRLSKLLYGDATTLGLVVPYDPLNPRAARPNRVINPGGAIGAEPVSALKTPGGYIGDLDALEAKRKKEIDDLNNILDDAKTDPTNVIPSVPAPATGGVSMFAGAPGGLPKGLRQRANVLQQMVNELTEMIETPETLQAMADAITTNNAALTAYQIQKKAYDDLKQQYDLLAQFQAFDNQNTAIARFQASQQYIEEKKARDELELVIGMALGNGKPNRRSAKDLLAGRPVIGPGVVPNSPWNTYVNLMAAHGHPLNMGGVVINIANIQATVRNNDSEVIKMRTVLGTNPLAPVAPVADPGPPLPDPSNGGTIARPAGLAPLGADPRTTALTGTANVLSIGTGNGQIAALPVDGNALETVWPSIVLVPRITIGGFRTQLTKSLADLAAEQAGRASDNAASITSLTTERARVTQLQTDLQAMTTLRDGLNDTLYGVGGNAGNIIGGVMQQLAAANVTIAQLQADVLVINNAIAAVMIGGRQAQNIKDITDRLANLELSEQKTKDAIAVLLQLNPDLRIVTANDNATDIGVISVAIQGIISNMSTLNSENKRLTQELERVTRILKEKEAALQTATLRMSQLLKALKANGVAVDTGNGDALDFTGYDAMRSSKLQLHTKRRLKRLTVPMSLEFVKRKQVAILRAKVEYLQELKEKNPDNVKKNDKYSQELADINGQIMQVDAGEDLDAQIGAYNKWILFLESQFIDPSILQQVTDDYVIQKFLQTHSDLVERMKSGVASGVVRRLDNKELRIFETMRTLNVQDDSVFVELQLVNKSSKAKEISRELAMVDVGDAGYPPGFIGAMVRYVENGKRGVKPDINDPSTYTPDAAAAAAASPTTGGGYFDGGDACESNSNNYHGRSLKGGYDTDVMLTAGVGGAVGSVMWFGWSGLIVFLLLLFIFFLSNNIFNNMCEKNDDVVEMRERHRYQHRRG